MSSAKICVVVATRNRWEFTKRFLESISKSTYKDYKIVITDDASADGTPEKIKAEYPEVILLYGNGNLYWAGGTNSGVKYALDNDFDYVLTINNDSTVGPEFLSIILKCSTENPNSLIGSLILKNTDGKIWSVGGRLDWSGPFLFNLNYFDRDKSIINELQNPFPVEIMNGNGTLIPTNILRKIGIFNTFFTPHYHADSEIALRAKKYGYNSMICLDTEVINEFDKKEKQKGLKFLFSKKSDYYLPALFYFYLKYNPNRNYLGLVRQYFHFYKENKILRKVAYMYRKYILKYPEDKL